MRVQKWLWVLIFALTLAGCQPASGSGASAPVEAATARPGGASRDVDPGPPHGAPPGSAATDAQRTLDSLARVDDFPLYVMHYHGDYGFAERLGRAQRQSRRPSQTEYACTGFTARTPAGERLLGRNFDWQRHPALLLFTAPPGALASLSMVDISYLGFSGALDLDDRPGLERLLQAPYLPFDGLNAAGLAVGMMAVPHGEGGDDADKVTLDSLELIRLLLDYAANLEQALGLVEQYNVDFGGGPPVHYLIADAAGGSAVVEFIDGRAHVLRSPQPWQASTNFLFAETPQEQWAAGCWRYARAEQALDQAAGVLDAEQAMALLAGVAQPNTIWSLVYNLSQGEVRVAMDRKYERVYTFGLAP